jgi:hypothetical protein
MEGANVFTRLASGDDLNAVLAFVILALSTVIVIQWRHTINNTTPKWVFDRLENQLVILVDLVKKMDVIIEERLK